MVDIDMCLVVENRGWQGIKILRGTHFPQIAWQSHQYWDGLQVPLGTLVEYCRTESTLHTCNIE
jgi:hypothetical protein